MAGFDEACEKTTAIEGDMSLTLMMPGERLIRVYHGASTRPGEGGTKSMK